MSRLYSRDEQLEMAELTPGELSGRWYRTRSGEVRRNRRHGIHDRRRPIHPPGYGPSLAEVLAANPIERLLDYQRYPIGEVDPELIA